jgi:hypothetical protein
MVILYSCGLTYVYVKKYQQWLAHLSKGGEVGEVEALFFTDWTLVTVGSP